MSDDPGAQDPQAAPPGSVPLTDAAKVIPRDKPDVTRQREELVKEWMEKIEEAEEHWKGTFAMMRESGEFAAGRIWPGERPTTSEKQLWDDRYNANITLRHINQRVSSIYAKNPRVRAIRRPKIYYNVWDGSPEMMMAATQGLPDPQTAMTVIAEATEATNKKKLYEKMGQTLEIVAQYSLDEPIPKFKTQAKQLVRRALTCKVGYVKLGYQRLMQYDSADVDARIKDASDRLAGIQVMADDLADKEFRTDSSEAEELKLQLEALQKQKEMVAREGVMFSFPKAWALIPDTNVTQLKGFVGAEWIAEKYVFTPKQVQKIYKIDVSKSYSAHTPHGQRGDKRKNRDKLCAVYEVYDINGQVCFTLCAGYPDYLKEPGEPNVKLQQFHPYYALYFNDTEDPETVYPPSDVELVRSMQIDYNRGREGLRVHRQANRPATVAAKGVFDEATKIAFSTHADHEMIESNLTKADDISKVLVPKPVSPIQADLYDVEHAFTDIMRVVGDQEANLGGTSNSTATEVSVAENSRVTSLQSNIDDLDEFLTDLMRGAGEVLLLEMSVETVKKIAGPGACWPQFSRQEVTEEMCLEIKAGSSGRPNKGARLAAIEKAMPSLLQIPGFKPEKLGEFVMREIDEGIDIEDFRDDALPSIVAMNSMAKPNLAPGPGSEAQGPQGAANAEAPAQTSAKAQNMYPAPPLGAPA